ncbi:MAG: hypothetical protein EOO10_06910 [Chitinophagaceae bacterium]|nr:MAG: hypothetical protein EOO10_06910 [Chitinophagaceae bacterium]
MKTRILTLCVSAMLLVTSVSFAQSKNGKPSASGTTPDPIFSSLRTHRQAKGTATDWSLSNLNGVIGFTVQRTYEDPNDEFAYWEDLCTMACDASRRFSYNDKEVFPGVISYRIAALMEDGSTLFSELSSVRIVSRK